MTTQTASPSPVASSRLAGKVAVVTGASRGIGRAIAERFAREGALVAVHYGQKRDQADAVAAAIAGAGGRAFTVGADFTDADAVAAFYAALDAGLREHGGHTGFDILVNNAGLPSGGLADTDEALFARLWAVNVRAPFFLAKAGLERLRDGGRVINLSSVASHIALPEAMAYAMTKGAIDSLTRSLARVLGPRGITVNAIAPGFVDTDMNAGLRVDANARAWASSAAALNRIGSADEVAAVAAFLASDDGRWVNGALVDVSGGSLLGRIP